MILKKAFYNIKCDCCGQIFDDENYWDDIDGLESMLHNSSWKITEDGMHYCPECYEYDDNDFLVTKNGHMYDECGNRLVHRKDYQMNYMMVGEWMTLTQFRMEISKYEALFRTMVGSVYKVMVAKDLDKARAWFAELYSKREGTSEWECYNTFRRHEIFEMFRDDELERIYT